MGDKESVVVRKMHLHPRMLLRAHAHTRTHTHKQGDAQGDAGFGLLCLVHKRNHLPSEWRSLFLDRSSLGRWLFLQSRSLGRLDKTLQLNLSTDHSKKRFDLKHRIAQTWHKHMQMRAHRQRHRYTHVYTQTPAKPP